MNTTHLHLLINHLPVFGTLMGMLVLIYGLMKHNNTTKKAAYMVFIVSAIGGVIAYYTGSPAAHSLKNIPGDFKPLIHEHAEAANFALISMSIVAVLSIIAFILTVKNSAWIKRIAIITLIVSLWAFSVVARTAYLGGLIRHSNEINSTGSAEMQNAPIENPAEDQEKH